MNGNFILLLVLFSFLMDKSELKITKNHRQDKKEEKKEEMAQLLLQ